MDVQQEKKKKKAAAVKETGNCPPESFYSPFKDLYVHDYCEPDGPP